MIICNSFLKRLLTLLLEAVLPLLAGGLIYIFFRTDSLFMFSWFEYLNISGFIHALRESIIISPNYFIKSLLNTVPNGLWTFSYTAFMLFVWKNRITGKNINYFIFIPFIAVLSEYLQLVGFVRGTFDTLDIFSYLTGAVLPLLIHFHKIKIVLK